MAQYAAERAEAAAPAVADPAPLGLSAFALTLFVLSFANAGLFSGPKIVIGLALFYGGIVLLIVGLQGFRAGNTFGATAFSSYGGFWLAFGFSLWQNLIPNNTALGYFLLGWTIFTVLLFLYTLRTNIALIIVFGLLILTLIALTLHFLGVANLLVIGGYLGILTALAAWYTALAGLLASGKAIFSLPVGPIS